MFERIRRSDVTTAAHVSSAEDSMARTVKFVYLVRARRASDALAEHMFSRGARRVIMVVTCGRVLVLNAHDGFHVVCLLTNRCLCCR